MMAAAGPLPLLVTSFPQEAWGYVPVLAGARGSVPGGAGAQAPVCRVGVFLLTLLKLWDLEHALGLELQVHPASLAPICPLSLARQKAQPVHPGLKSPLGALVL